MCALVKGFRCARYRIVVNHQWLKRGHISMIDFFLHLIINSGLDSGGYFLLDNHKINFKIGNDYP
jgi:hypothetical protein